MYYSWGLSFGTVLVMAKNGIHRSILLTKEQDDRLNRLLVATGMNRNALIRLWIEQSTPDGIREMQCH